MRNYKRKYILISIFLLSLAWTMPLAAQSSSKIAFNQAATYFIEGNNEQALSKVNSALNRYPNDPQLKALKEKLEQQQEEQQNQEQKQDKSEDSEGEEQESGEEKSEEEKGEGEEGEEGKPDEEQEPEDGQEGDEGKEGDEGEEEETESEQEQPGEEKESDDEQEDGTMKDVEKRLQEMNISPENARMILEAMKSNEVQYLQQKKRKQSKRSDSDKPDW